jgi:16S rRNA (guanine966-N2)-methyltransferase
MKRKPSPAGKSERRRQSSHMNDDAPAEKRPARPIKARPSSLRIIGGEMRGRQVQYHGASFTRPMKDSVRENLFNILGTAVRGTICYDVFAGTGALAFESLSRGATHAVAIEQSRIAVDWMRRTAENLDVLSRITIHTGDAFRWLPKLMASPRVEMPWIVMLAPPYSMWEESLEPLNGIIRLTQDQGPPGSFVVAEMDKRFDTSRLVPGDWDIRRYGGTQLAIVECGNQCGLNL